MAQVQLRAPERWSEFHTLTPTSNIRSHSSSCKRGASHSSPDATWWRWTSSRARWWTTQLVALRLSLRRRAHLGRYTVRVGRCLRLHSHTTVPNTASSRTSKCFKSNSLILTSHDDFLSSLSFHGSCDPTRSKVVFNLGTTAVTKFWRDCKAVATFVLVIFFLFLIFVATTVVILVVVIFIFLWTAGRGAAHWRGTGTLHAFYKVSVCWSCCTATWWLDPSPNTAGFWW